MGKVEQTISDNKITKNKINTFNNNNNLKIKKKMTELNKIFSLILHNNLILQKFNNFYINCFYYIYDNFYKMYVDKILLKVIKI